MKDDNNEESAVPMADDAAPEGRSPIPAHQGKDATAEPPVVQAPSNEAAAEAGAPSEPAAEAAAAPDPASPNSRVMEEILALFDSTADAGEKKSQAAALLRTLLSHAPAAPKSDTDTQSAKVSNRVHFLPTRPKVDFTPVAGPTSQYDALRRPSK